MRQTGIIIGLMLVVVTTEAQPVYRIPFNASTVIGYTLPVTSAVTLKVYNLLGQKVATLVKGFQEAGFYQVSFGASGLASGIYLYSLHVADPSGKNLQFRSSMLFLK